MFTNDLDLVRLKGPSQGKTLNSGRNEEDTEDIPEEIVFYEKNNIFCTLIIYNI